MDVAVTYMAHYKDHRGEFEVEQIEAVRDIPPDLAGRQLVMHVKRAIRSRVGATIDKIRILECHAH
jgi:hypothetical protein